MKKGVFNHFLVLAILFAFDFKSKDTINAAEFIVSFNVQNDSTLLKQLERINKKEFIGKSVEVFPKDKTVSKYISYFFVDEKPGLLSHLVLNYSNNLSIEVFVKDYKYVKQFNINRNWSFIKFKKEKIGEIHIVYLDNTVNW